MWKTSEWFGKIVILINGGGGSNESNTGAGESNNERGIQQKHTVSADDPQFTITFNYELLDDAYCLLNEGKTCLYDCFRTFYLIKIIPMCLKHIIAYICFS